MESLRILNQIFKYVMANRKYWIMPFAIFLVALAVVLVSAEGSFVAPFIYSLF